jgi:hypothetical protein
LYLNNEYKWLSLAWIKYIEHPTYCNKDKARRRRRRYSVATRYANQEYLLGNQKNNTHYKELVV